jgi:hypothetical protein
MKVVNYVSGRSALAPQAAKVADRGCSRGRAGHIGTLRSAATSQRRRFGMGVFAIIGLLLVLGGMATKNRKLVIGGLIVMGIGLAARFHH